MGTRFVAAAHHYKLSLKSLVPMMTFKFIAVAGLTAVFLISGCAKKSETTYTDSSSSAATTPAHTDTAVATTPPPAPALNDANIVAMLIEADSGEVAQAQLVSTKTKNSAVKGFAQEMIKDHTKLKADAEALAKKMNVTPQPPANDTHPSELTQWMSTLSGTADAHALDSVYMNHMVEDHSKDIQDVTDMQSKAQSADLKAAIDKAMPILKKHLADAQNVVKKLEASAKPAKK
jgi:putative membrane protein